MGNSAHGKASGTTEPQGGSVGLKEDSNKSMGHDPSKHMPRVHSAPRIDQANRKPHPIVKGSGDSMRMASKTSTPFAKSYGNPKEK